MNKEKYIYALKQEIKRQPSKDALQYFIEDEKKEERIKILSPSDLLELQQYIDAIYEQLPSDYVIPSQETDGLYYLEEGLPVMIGDDWLDKYREDESD